jgi:hypothetical protein
MGRLPLEGTVHYISILSTAIVILFVLAVLGRYSKKGGTHLLLWGIGLVFFGLGTFSEAVMLFTFNPLILKVWYFSGAMMTAAWLGQGTVHLLVRKRAVAQTMTAALVVVSLVALGLLISAPITSAAASFDVGQPASEQYQEILLRDTPTTILTILLNVYGTVTLVGGALYSSYIFWRKRVLAERMLGNIFIAAGALMPAMGGTFSRAGLPDWLYLSEFLGALLMFAGFMKATSSQSAQNRIKVPSTVK